MSPPRYYVGRIPMWKYDSCEVTPERLAVAVEAMRESDEFHVGRSLGGRYGYDMLGRAFGWTDNTTLVCNCGACPCVSTESYRAHCRKASLEAALAVLAGTEDQT